MCRQALPLIGLLVAYVVASTAFAQLPEGQFREFQRLPPTAEWPPVVDSPPIGDRSSIEAGPPESPTGGPMPTDAPMKIGPLIDLSRHDGLAESGPLVEPFQPVPLDAFLGYRYESSSLDWILGNDDQFGMFSILWDHYQRPGAKHGLDVGLQFHFLNGPVRTDMPSKVYDFSIAYQHRDRIGVFGYDAAVSVMASSDFEGSSREGIRFPSHAVGFLSVHPALELVFGVDYLDRGDVKLLPVGGLIVLPHPDVRLEAVFPRPRVVFRLTDRHHLYVGGELGGGTWAIERATGADDLASYRDLRVSIGLQHFGNDHSCTTIEIGYLFDRRLEYTSGQGDYRPTDTAVIRLINTF
ncbi:MAG: hypothetical protein ABFD16_07870 [Thermoguttaceae bacterium]|jgi:hypothetical protein